MSAPWPDRRAIELLGIEVPIVQAPMAGSTLAEMAIAVANAGGLGSIPCALLSPDAIREQVTTFRKHATKPLNLNFFSHVPTPVDADRERRWRERLDRYYVELGIDPAAQVSAPNRAPFDDAMCAVVEELAPAVVSFHFGLPEASLLDRVQKAGAKILSSATTVAEARWLAERGCDAIIAQGYEAGGHRGMFLSDDVATQVGTFSLVPQIADAVKVPVIAAGGIADARGIVAAFALGASAVQIGTAYLFCPEAKVSPTYAKALRAATDDGTAITNVFTGRPARGVVNRAIRELGPMSTVVPGFPHGGAALAPLRAKAEADFAQQWAGQSVRLGRELSAGELTIALAREAARSFSRS